MIDQVIYECQLYSPSLEKASKLVPEEFLPCWRWFIDNAGSTIPRLPHRMKEPPKTPIPLSRDSGIYIPSTNRVKYKGGEHYALSVHSKLRGKYHDKLPIERPDGTWLVEYSAHEGKDTLMGYNDSLMNCLEKGVPVGVMVEEKRGGYRVLGLAFVERYNSLTGTFSLHGPVSMSTVAAGLFQYQGFDQLSDNDRIALAQADDIISQTDERRVVQAQQVRREQQSKFRQNLIDAYSGACAITNTQVPEVLQAAHIDPYRGKKSQLTSNGILLRADFHLLFDAHLISIVPDTHRIMLSEELRGTPYEAFLDKQMRMPEDVANEPNPKLLEEHLEQFLQTNKPLVA